MESSTNFNQLNQLEDDFENDDDSQEESEEESTSAENSLPNNNSPNNSNLNNDSQTSSSEAILSSHNSNVSSNQEELSNEQAYNQMLNNDNMVEYQATGNYFCSNCNSYSELVEDHRAGDQVCNQCGAIAQERLIAQDAEYRVFSEDSASYSKVHYGAAYNTTMEYSLTEKSRLERDEKEFLWDGIKNIEEIFYRLSKGDSSNAPAQQRAKELFQQAFHLQVEQKKGTVAMKRSGGSDKKSKKNRQKFSRRKQFVISALFQALKENGINTWNIQDLSEQLDGIQVSKYSVRNCLKDLKLQK